jgi:hypothetical protein
VTSKAPAVALVVDRAFGGRLYELARDRHVWIVDTVANRPLIERARKTSDADGDPLGPGVTSFAPELDESAEAAVERILDDVVEHHREPAEIAVYGARLSDRLREVFEERGFTTFRSTPDGFVAGREAAS